MFYWLLKIILGPIVRLIWVNEVDGLQNIPRKGSLLIAPNHSSYFDFLCLIAVTPRRIKFLAAEVFYKSKFWKPLMILTGQIKVDRQSKDKTESYNKIREAIKEGYAIGIFPEGTRSRSGKLQRAYSGVAKIALENKIDILPVAIKGAYEVMTPHEKKPKFEKMIKIKYLDAIGYKDFKNLSPEKITHEILMPQIAKEIGQKYPNE